MIDLGVDGITALETTSFGSHKGNLVVVHYDDYAQRTGKTAIEAARMVKGLLQEKYGAISMRETVPAFVADIPKRMKDDE